MRGLGGESSERGKRERENMVYNGLDEGWLNQELIDCQAAIMLPYDQENCAHRIIYRWSHSYLVNFYYGSYRENLNDREWQSPL